MTRLVLLRHGLTEWNADGRWQGHTDIALTETGRRQAAEVAPCIAALAPDALWSSDLARARDTARAVESATGLEAVVDVRLREVHVGSFAGRYRADVIAEHGHGPWDYGQHGGESDHEVVERVAGLVDEVVATLGESGTGVLVSHGHTVRLTTLHLLGWPLERVHDLGAMANCGWVELDRPDPAAGWRLTAYNRTAPIS